MDYVKADLFKRTTAEETQEFFNVVADSALKNRRSKILISVHSSAPVFAVERSGFLTHFRNVSVEPSHKIALVADTLEIGYSHQYMEILGKQQGINVKNFRDEVSAVAWIKTEH